MLASLVKKHRHKTADLQVELQFICEEEPHGKFNSLQGKNYLQKGLHSLLFLKNFVHLAAFILIILALGCSFCFYKLAVGILHASKFSLLQMFSLFIQELILHLEYSWTPIPSPGNHCELNYQAFYY